MSRMAVNGVDDAFPRVVLDPRLNGPRRTANGGFACGHFAETVGGTARVKLLRPPPLGVALDVVGDRAQCRVLHRGRVVAEVTRLSAFVNTPPVVPSLADAAVAREAHPMRGIRHALSGCVVCGPDRQDGLGVTPGPLPGRPDVLAAPFVPHERDAVDGVVAPAAVWGALDCPSYPAQLMVERSVALLGSLAVHQRRDIHVGEELVVVGWTNSTRRRSHHTSSALLDQQGDVVASGQATWVELRHQRTARLIGRLL